MTIWKIIRRAAAAVLFLLLGLVVVNLWDVSPSPAVTQLIANQRNAFHPEPPADQNGFVWMLGLSAPPGTSPVVWGQRHLIQLRALAELQREEDKASKDPWTQIAGVKATAQPVSPIRKTAQSQLDGFAMPTTTKPWCRPEFAPCLRDFAKRKADIAQQYPLAAQLLPRIQGMHDAPTFFTSYVPSTFDAPNAPLINLSFAQQNVFFLAALRAENGDQTGAAKLLRDNATFQRKVLSNNGDMVYKNVANALLVKNLVFTKELFTYYSTKPEVVTDYLKVVSPEMTLTEQSLAPAIENEARRAAALFDMDGLTHWASSFSMIGLRIFFQPQRTINCMVDRYGPFVTLSQLPTQQFLDERSRYVQVSASRHQFPLYAYAINPIGRIVCSVELPYMDSYIGQTHDLEVLRRAVVLSLSVDPNNYASINTLKHQPQFFNPITGQPFEIDASSRTIRFLTIETNKGWGARIHRTADGFVGVAY